MLIVESLSAIHLTADRSGTAGDEWRLKVRWRQMLNYEW
jgi:hypothetical protein